MTSWASESHRSENTALKQELQHQETLEKNNRAVLATEGTQT